MAGIVLVGVGVCVKSGVMVCVGVTVGVISSHTYSKSIVIQFEVFDTVGVKNGVTVGVTVGVGVSPVVGVGVCVWKGVWDKLKVGVGVINSQ